MWVPGVLRATPAYAGSVRDWLVHSAWAPSSLITPKKAVLDVHDHAELVDALVNDFISLSTAAFESAISVEVRGKEPDGCAWQVVSYYYSAYFAANAIMRLAGFICTNLEADVCAEINERALLYGYGGLDERSKVAPAVFYGLFSSSRSPSLFFQSLSGVRGGVHIQFWAGFQRFLDAVASELKSSPLPTTDKKVAKKEIQDLRDALTRSNRPNGSWLSEVRNAVNYRFEGGVWYPYRSGVDGNVLRSQLRTGVAGQSGLLAATSSDHDCKRLVSVSAFLLRWIKSSLEVVDVNARQGKRRRIREGPLAFSADI